MRDFVDVRRMRTVIVLTHVHQMFSIDEGEPAAAIAARTLSQNV